MKKLNTHGYIMDGLEDAALWTAGLPESGLPRLVIEVAYDRADGIVCHEVHFDGDSWCEWGDGVERIGFYTHRRTAQQLANDIAVAMRHMEDRRR